MSYIVSRDIPKGCEHCPFNGHTKCRIMPIGFDEYPLVGRRQDWCPLIEVKTPHGRLGDLDELKAKFRLVDADKLMMSIADWWYSSFGEEETDDAKAIRTVMDKIEQSIVAMTAVEAEGRNDVFVER